MRVAWLCPYLPLAENTGGRIRIARLASGFAADDELLLYSRISKHDDVQAAQVPRAFGPWRQVRALPSAAPGSSLSLRPNPARSMPKGLGQLLQEDDERAPFDAVIVEHCYAFEVLPALRRAAVIVDEHNIESEYYRRLVKQKPFGLSEYLVWRRYERAVWRRADEVVTVSERDRDQVRRVQPSKGLVASNGTLVEAFRYVPPSRRSGSAILYVGMMSYPPNIAAARLLALEVLPALRKRVPDATLTIAGRDAQAQVRALASEHVHVTGTLPEVFGLFDRHAAYALPLFEGAGSSLKVLEPFAAGLPLVSSEFGVRGYGLSGAEYLRADDVAGFVSGLERAIRKRGELDAMAERAREVAARHSWSAISRQFAGIVRQSVQARMASR